MALLVRMIPYVPQMVICFLPWRLTYSMAIVQKIILKSWRMAPIAGSREGKTLTETYEL